MAAYRRPESVLVVIHSGREVLLLHRVAPFSFWQSVTGSLEEGESPREAAIREVFEETGLSVGAELIDAGVTRSFIIDPRWRDRYAPGVTENIEYGFRLALPETQAICCDRSEHDAFEWVALDEAIARVWSNTNQAALEDLASEIR